MAARVFDGSKKILRPRTGWLERRELVDRHRSFAQARKRVVEEHAVLFVDVVKGPLALVEHR